MKEWAIISLSIEPEHRAKLDAIYPSGGEEYEGYNARIPLNDPRFDRIILAIEELGKRPWLNRGRLSDVATEYHIRYAREYDATDLTVAELLELRPMFRMADSRDGSRLGPIKIYEREIRADYRFTFGIGVNWIVVPDLVRDNLEASGLQNIRFRETALYVGSKNAKRVEWSESLRAPWWELGSDTVMPHLVAPKLRNKRWEPTDGSDRTSGCFRIDGFYTHPELHYRREDIDKMPAFDLARTWEPFGNGKLYDDDRAFVCSQRFYQFCLKQGWETNWVPVRIDE